KMAEVHGFDRERGLLRVGKRIEQQATEHVGQHRVAYAPSFQSGILLGVKQPAIVAGNRVFLVFPFVRAVDEVAKLLNVLVEPRSSTAVELGKVLQRIDETSEREFFVEFPRPGFDRQKVAAFGVKDEKQAIEENQTVLVELAPVLVRVIYVILRAFDKTVGEDFDEREDTLAQVFLKISLCSQGTLAD